MKIKKEIGQVLNEVQTILESYKRVAESTGENFNIFSILQMESNEVSTHSRFIAELLNIKGRHNLNDKFLKNFINVFAPDSSLIAEKSKVIVEYYIGKVEDETGGRIDILIKDDNENVIMIENKIYASEQPNQLLRYHNAFPNGELLYLTLFGEDSEQESSKNLYKNISYETDIINWLEICKKDAVNIPILRESISQYINLLKKLTNQNLNKKMNEDIISRILRDKNGLTAYKTLIDVNVDLKKELIKSIIEKINKILTRKEFINIKTMDFSKDRGRLIEFQTQSLIKKNLKFRLNFEGNSYSNLIIGFIKEDIKQDIIPQLFESFKKEYPNAKQSDWWNGYIYYEGYKNWYYHTLSEIYFDEDETFYKDLENKIDNLLMLIEIKN